MQDRSEIRGSLDDPVRTGPREFLAIAVAPEDTDAGDAVHLGALDVVATITHHHQRVRGGISRRTGRPP